MRPRGSIATWFLFAMAGLAGLLYGIDIGVISAALPYIKATTSFSDAQLSLVEAENDTVNGYVSLRIFAIVNRHDYLPEIDVECNGEAKDNYGVDDIPVVPALTSSLNLLRCRGTEYQTLNLLLIRSFGNQ